MSLIYQPVDHKADLQLPYRFVSLAVFTRESDKPAEEREDPKAAPSTELKLESLLHITAKGCFQQEDSRYGEAMQVSTDDLLTDLRKLMVVAIYSNNDSEHQEFVDKTSKIRDDKAFEALSRRILDHANNFKGPAEIPHSQMYQGLQYGMHVEQSVAQTIVDKNASGVLVTDRHIIYKAPQATTVEVGEGSLPTTVRQEPVEEVADLIGARQGIYFDYKTWSKMFPLDQNEITTPKEWLYILPALRTNLGLSAKSPCIQGAKSSSFDPFDL